MAPSAAAASASSLIPIDSSASADRRTPPPARSRSSRTAGTSPWPPRRVASIRAIVIRPMTVPPPSSPARRQSSSGVIPALCRFAGDVDLEQESRAAPFLGRHPAQLTAGSGESTEWMTSKPAPPGAPCSTGDGRRGATRPSGGRGTFGSASWTRLSPSARRPQRTRPVRPRLASSSSRRRSAADPDRGRSPPRRRAAGPEAVVAVSDVVGGRRHAAIVPANAGRIGPLSRPCGEGSSGCRGPTRCRPGADRGCRS